MSANIQSTKTAPDQRLLVLLAIAVTLCLIRLLPENGRAGGTVFATPQADRETAYFWLSDSQRPEGLYRISTRGLSKDSEFDSFRSLAPHLKEIKENDPDVPPRAVPLFFAPIPINQADRELLMTLPGIGPRLAERIIALRQKDKINNHRELLKVNGIGKVKSSKLKGLIRFD